MSRQEEPLSPVEMLGLVVKAITSYGLYVVGIICCIALMFPMFGIVKVTPLNALTPMAVLGVVIPLLGLQAYCLHKKSQR